MTTIPEPAADLAVRTFHAELNGLCTPHARRYEHRDPAANPLPVAVAHWTGPNGSVDLLCASCLASWLRNASDDPGLLPARLVVDPGWGRGE